MGPLLVVLGVVCIAAAALVDAPALFRINLAVLGTAIATAGWLLRRSPTEPAPPHASNPPWPILAAILVVAIVLRAIGLGSGLWYDEVVTLVEFVRLPTAELLTQYKVPNNHILYTLSAQASIAAFGDTDAALRVPAAAFGVASIAALWYLGRRVTGSAETVLACSLLAVSYHHVWFSQNARGYTGLLLCTLLGTALFVQGLRRQHAGIWLGYAGVAALAMYTHLSAVFVFGAHGLIYLAALTVGRRRYPGATGPWPILGFALSALLTLQLYALLIPQMFDAFGAQAGVDSANVKVAEWTSLSWMLSEIWRAVPIHNTVTAVAAVVGGALAITGLVSYWRRDPALTAAMVLPAPITLLALTAISFHAWPRYFFGLAGFAVLIGLRGIAVVAERIQPQKAGPLVVAAGALAIVGSAFHLTKNYTLPKQDFAGARDWVESQRQPGEPVLTVGMASLPFERHYAPDWTAIETNDELDAAIASHTRVWLVFSLRPVLAASHPEIDRRIPRGDGSGDGADLIVQRVFGGTLANGNITVCTNR